MIIEDIGVIEITQCRHLKEEENSDQPNILKRTGEEYVSKVKKNSNVEARTECNMVEAKGGERLKGPTLATAVGRLSRMKLKINPWV